MHAQIVNTAARNFRERGVDGIGVASLMKGLGLTHGGFYAHFASRDALVEEALHAAFDETLGHLRTIVEAAPAGQRLDTLVRSYVSEAHRDNAAHSCFAAAVGPEASRHSPAIRAALAAELRRFLELIDFCLAADGRPEASEAVLSSLIGAITLSRMVRDDAALSNAALRQTRRLWSPPRKAAEEPRLAARGHSAR